MSEFVGVHFSNELFDALPVHLLVAEDAKGDFWQEKGVDLRNGTFVFVQQSVTDLLLRSRLPLLPSRPAGYSTEVNLAALDLIEAVRRALADELWWCTMMRAPAAKQAITSNPNAFIASLTSAWLRPLRARYARRFRAIISRAFAGRRMSCSIVTR
jgi:hypothetical protein